MTGIDGLATMFGSLAREITIAVVTLVKLRRAKKALTGEATPLIRRPSRRAKKLEQAQALRGVRPGVGVAYGAGFYILRRTSHATQAVIMLASSQFTLDSVYALS